MVYSEYTWVFGFATVFSFISAFGIGANDLANSFASSVGARAVTISQACLIAAVCEFSGAVGLGAAVTSTIKGGITNVSSFRSTPDLFLFGMFCVLIAAAFWDNFACHLELPVSTTHTTVGAVVGMAMALKGGSAVIWAQKKDEFPFVSGMVPIFLSWITSPLLSGICVVIIFSVVRVLVLRPKDGFQRAFYLLPVFAFLTFFVITAFIIQTGNNTKSWSKVPEVKIIWISIVIAAGCSILILFAVMPVLRNWVLEEEKERERNQDAEAKGGIPGLADVEEVKQAAWWDNTMAKFNDFKENTTAGRILINNPIFRTLFAGLNENVHESVKTDSNVADVWNHAEVFDWRTEALFRYLQVFSAMVMSFAHGANDVANAIGPYAAIYTTWQTSAVPGSNNSIPRWIYLMGGAAMVLGLATYGHHILRVLGVKVAKLTNARGFCAEISTAMVVVTASRYGLPVSTTQVATGAILGVGLMEGLKGVNWKVVMRIFGGWVLTLIVAGFLSAGLVSFATFAPSKIAADNVVILRKVLLAEIYNMKNQLNATNLASASFNSTINSTLTAIVKNWTSFNGTSKGFTDPIGLLDLQMNTLSLFNTTYAVGN